MPADLPFLSDAALEAALIVLENHRKEHSLDEWFSQAGVYEAGVPAALREEAVRAAGDLSFLPVDGRIPVFREIVAPKDWDHASEIRPHLFWSHSAELAHAHWAEGDGVRWLLSGSVAAEDVDEARTIALNANPVLSHEGEIVLVAGSVAKIDRIERRPPGHSHPFL